MPIETDRLELRPGFVEDLPAVHEVFVAASRGRGQPTEWRTPEEVRSWVLGLLGERVGRAEVEGTLRRPA